MLAAGRSLALLARWLGPWADESRAPRVLREETTVPAGPRGEDPFPARLYLPRRGRQSRAFLLAPGLHYAGPDDPRLDRFCAILAASGALVYAPFLPSFTSLRVTPASIEELARALDALLGSPRLPSGCRPTVFSISFGSLPALRLAASPAHADAIESLVVFGGYADFARTIDFCLTGELDGRPHVAHDPLNRPVAVMNLLPWIEEAPPEPEPVLEGWHLYVRSTWGRPEMKVPSKWRPLAQGIAAGLPAALREFFLVGCGVIPGARDLCQRALEKAGAEAGFLDPRPHLGGLKRPVDIIHGLDDDVIPYVECETLAESIGDSVPVRVHLTGLYGHSRVAGAGLSPFALGRELRSLTRILRLLSRR